MPPAIQLLNATTQATILPQLELATNFWTRFWGWQFRRPAPRDQGLLIVPCGSIHTHWMRFAIDVLFVNRQGEVLSIRSNLSPWRMVVGPKDAYAVVETQADALIGKVHVGDRLELLVRDKSHPIDQARHL